MKAVFFEHLQASICIHLKKVADCRSLQAASYSWYLRDVKMRLKCPVSPSLPVHIMALLTVECMTVWNTGHNVTCSAEGVYKKDGWYEITDVRSWGAAESWNVKEIVRQITGMWHSFRWIRQYKIPIFFFFGLSLHKGKSCIYICVYKQKTRCFVANYNFLWSPFSVGHQQQNIQFQQWKLKYNNETYNFNNESIISTRQSIITSISVSGLRKIFKFAHHLFFIILHISFISGERLLS
jgi:hypothetical protein